VPPGLGGQVLQAKLLMEDPQPVQLERGYSGIIDVECRPDALQYLDALALEE